MKPYHYLLYLVFIIVLSPSSARRFDRHWKLSRSVLSSEIEWVFILGNNYLFLLNFNDSNTKTRTNLPSESLYDIEVDLQAKKFFWIDIVSYQIKTADVSLPQVQLQNWILPTAKNFSNARAHRFSLDWLTKKIYWIDLECLCIKVSDYNAKFIKVIIWKNVEEPEDIIVHPPSGVLFWSTWGISSHISSCFLDGTGCKLIATDGLHSPTSLSISNGQERLFWLDDKTKMLSSVRLNGSSRIDYMKLLDADRIMFAHSDVILWTSDRSPVLHAISLNQKIPSESMNLPSKGPYLFFKSSPAIRPENPCLNSSCDQLCLLSPRLSARSNRRRNAIGDNISTVGAVCACSTGLALLPNGLTCPDHPTSALLLRRRMDLRLISLDMDDYTPIELPQRGKFSDGAAVAIDPIDKVIYWTEEVAHKIMIFSGKIGSNRSFVLPLQNFGKVEGLAVDWVSKNLYWVDSKFERVEVSRLDGSHRLTVVQLGLNKPRSIAVDPILGLLFWCDWGLSRIESSRLDGTERTVIVSEDVEWPNGLALDLHGRRIYWIDGKLERIESANYDGTGRRVVLEKVFHGYGLAFLNDFVYWTSWDSRKLEKVHALTGTNRSIVVRELPDMMGLVPVEWHATYNTLTDHQCAVENGGCSQLCFHSRRPQCACGNLQVLGADGRTCSYVDAFILAVRPFLLTQVVPARPTPKLTDLPIKVSNCTSAVVSAVEQRVYWLEGDKLACSFFDGSAAQVLVNVGLSAASHLAVDGVNLVWSNNGMRRIEMSTLGGQHRRVLVWDLKDGVTSMVLHTQNGELYFSIGHVIFVARLDQPGIYKPLIREDDGTIEGLAIEASISSLSQAFSSSLFWVNSRYGLLKKMNLSNGNVTAFAQPMADLGASVTILGDNLYMSNRKWGSLWQLNKSDMSTTRLNVRVLSDVLSLSSYDSLSSSRGACRRNLCSHLCVPVDVDEHRCVCPSHFRPTPNNASCIRVLGQLLVAHPHFIGRVVAGGDAGKGPPEMPFMLGNALRLGHYKNRVLMITGRHQLLQSGADGTDDKFVKSSARQKPFDLAVDESSALLFWSDTMANVINVTRLRDGKTLGAVVTNGTPRYLTVSSRAEILFWSDGPHSIRQSHYDGSNMKSVVSGLKNVTDLAVCDNLKVICWVDKPLVACTAWDHDSSVFVVHEAPHILSIAIQGANIFWTDSTGKLFQQTLLKGKPGSVPYRLMINVPDGLLNDIAPIADPSTKDQLSPCSSDDYDGCSHFCLERIGIIQCACPPGLVLLPNSKHCVIAVECPDTQWGCRTGNQCIDKHLVCDGLQECWDGSDEENCRACPTDSFLCTNRQCVSKSARCNGSIECFDRSDERKCLCTRNTPDCVSGISLHQRQQHTGVIVATVLVIAFLMIVLISWCHMRSKQGHHISHPPNGGCMSSGNSHAENPFSKTQSQSSLYSRGHITGQSSYSSRDNRIPANPPPSPASSFAYPSYNHIAFTSPSNSSFYSSLMYGHCHYPPMPTPCSTDVCESDTMPDQSDSDALISHPPPPTPHTLSDAAPSSVTDLSCTYTYKVPPPTPSLSE